MTWLSWVPAALLAALGAGLLTGSIRAYALRRSMVDVPGARSSHTVPTPRGGGLSIVVLTLAGLLIAAAAGAISWRLCAALAGGGALVAAVGWQDDRTGMGRRTRFAVHMVAAAWTVYWLGGLPVLDTGVARLDLGWAGSLLAVIAIVWCVNLYNFMDGLDGLAAGEASTVGVLGAVILIGSGALDLALVALLVAGAATGFLVWNWAPARIFMGDVGSGFLGFLFGALAVASQNAGAAPALAWAILLGVFVFDATVTLARRAASGEAWYTEHRSHAYQRLARGGWGHARVSVAVLLVNVPLGVAAWIGTTRPPLLLPAVAASLLLLAALYLRVEAVHPFPRATTPHEVVS